MTSQFGLTGKLSVNLFAPDHIHINITQKGKEIYMYAPKITEIN